MYGIKMMMMGNNSMGKNNYACNQDKKFACMFSFKFQSIRYLKYLFKSYNGKNNKLLMQPGCKVTDHNWSKRPSQPYSRN